MLQVCFPQIISNCYFLKAQLILLFVKYSSHLISDPYFYPIFNIFFKSKDILSAIENSVPLVAAGGPGNGTLTGAAAGGTGGRESHDGTSLGFAEFTNGTLSTVSKSPSSDVRDRVE